MSAPPPPPDPQPPPESAYSTAHVRVIRTDTEAIRLRPAMYIGDTGSRGLHHLLFEVLNFGIDQYLAGDCKRIALELFADKSCSVRYDSSGPFNRLPLEFLGRYSHGLNLTAQPFSIQPSFCWQLGMIAAIALSNDLDVAVVQDGFRRSQSFRRGQPAEHEQTSPTADHVSTTVRFRPDETIFDAGFEFNREILAERFGELGYLLPGLELTLTEHRSGSNSPITQTFHSNIGLPEYLNCRSGERDWVHGEIFVVQTEGSEQRFELALRWTRESREEMRVYINLYRYLWGGTPLEGLRRALTTAIKKYGKIFGVLNDERLTAADCTAGLSAVLSVYVREPMWEGATRAKIVNPELTSLVQKAVNKLFPLYLEANPTDAIAIARRALEAYRQRQARKRRT